MRLNCVLAITLGIGAAAHALGTGDAAPEFEAATTAGPVKLDDLRGKWVVLMFYPKSFTPGCTKEACSVRDAYEKLAARGVAVFGISVDDLETQKKFKAAHQLPYELIADRDKKIAQAYGVLAPMGLFALRRTFVIAPDGRIAHVSDSVSVATHGDDLLGVLENLQSKAQAK